MTVNWPHELEPYLVTLLSTKCKTPLSILEYTEVELSELVGISITSAREAQQLIARVYSPAPESALHRLATRRKISSCIPSLDDILGGGLEESWLVELVGEASCGKTQWCLTMAAAALLHGSAVFWLDTENTFRPDRLVEILHGRVDMLSNVHSKRCCSLTELIDAFMSISDLLECTPHIDSGSPIVILDSVAAATLAQSSSLIDRTELLHRLARISKTMKAVTIVTNHVRARIGNSGATSQPALGNTWAHDVNCRLVMRLPDNEAQQRWIEIVKAPGIDQSCLARLNIRIGKDGVQEL